MSMFRKFRIGSADSDGSRGEGDLSNPPTQDWNDDRDETPALPYRSHSEPSQQLLQSDQDNIRSSALLTASDDALVTPSSSYQSSLAPSMSTRQRASRDKTPDGRLGLSLIHGDSDRDADIIFVHGLGGSSRSTWSWEHRQEVFWPAWVHDEEGLSHFRVFSYGYNANFRDSKNPLSILDFSKGLLVRMKTYGHGAVDDIGMKPIVFVAHSMGGLVVKKALIIGRHDDLFSTMLSRVHGILFLSTPHKGSPHARTLNHFLSIMLGTSTKVYVSELESSSTSIEDISEQFRAICGSWKLVSLYENLPTRLVSGIKKMLVGKDSGVLNYPKEISVAVDADHHTICKFRSRLDPNYLLVTRLLRQLTQDLYRHERVKPLDSGTADNSRILETMFGLQGNIREELESHISRAQPGSCQWFHRSESFQSWLHASDGANTVLWLTGLPGTGKSTLAAKTIDYIQKAVRCQHHFFIEAQPTKGSAAYCLRTIAFQLASEFPAFADKLIRLYQDTKFSATSQKFQVIWETIFENIVFHTDFGSILHWVVDGLDEADTPNLLVRHFMQLQSRTPIRILLLSRPKRELTSLVGSRSDLVSIEPMSIEHTAADIRDFVCSATREVLPQDERLQKVVIEQITSRAEGSFLWTRLALDSLWNNWHTKADIDMALNDVPKDMHALYQRMIANVKSQQPRLQDIAFRILTWAACAFRPLTIAELVAALRPEFDGFVNLAETVVQICGQFVSVDSGTISLIHSTARQFLLHSSGGIPAAVGLHTGHDHLARVCLQYLCQDVWRQTLARVSENRNSRVHDRLEPLYDEFPFLKYAMNFWAYHVSHASIDSPDLLLNLRLFCNRYILQWVQAVALSSNIANITKAAQYLKKWLRQRRKGDSRPMPFPTGSSLEEPTFLRHWVTDLIRIVGKFGTNLLRSPSVIHRHIPPFCPETSITARTYNQQDTPLISVEGLSSCGWDDNLARLSPGQDEIASTIRCGTIYFFTLISHNGTVIVWHMETCEELRRICHEEWVTLMEINKTGSLMATGGRYTYRIWDPASGQQLYVLPKHSPARSMSLGFAKTDSELLVGYDDCSVVSYNIGLSTETILFTAPGQDMLGNCPRFMVLSPDQTKLAIGFRGRPVLVWDVVTLSQPMSRSVIRTADKDRLGNGEDVYNSPEIVRWQPDGSVLYVLYQDATVLVWNLVDDIQAEFGHTEAREMVLNADGTLLLTSSNGGSASVWGLPKLNLIYRLQSDEFVRDLAFSPDAQRIYDVRGSGCNVWAPDALIRADELDREDTLSSLDGSYVSEVASEPVFAEDKHQGGRVTALTCDDEDEYFCCGRDDGSVIIHEMEHGARVRKICNHSAAVDIIAIAWSPSRRLIASADDSGKVIVKRLRIKDDDKWAVYPLLELRVGEAILQLLFSLNEAFLLISTGTTDRVWDVKSKIEICKRRHGHGSNRKWLNHPTDESQLIWLGTDQLQIHRWANLTPVEPPRNEALAETGSAHTGKASSLDVTETVETIVQPSNHQYLLYEIRPERNLTRSRLSRGNHIDIVQTADLKAGNSAPIRRKTLEQLGQEVQHLLGSYRDRAVFLNHSNWVCTCNIGWDMGAIKRHFFLPRGWVKDTASQLLLLSKHGTLLCARKGEVAIVRYFKGF